MSIRSKAKGEEGAAAVEFALIVGLLAILIFGLLEYGIAFWQVQNLRAATREGARVAAVGGDRERSWPRWRIRRPAPWVAASHSRRLPPGTHPVPTSPKVDR